MAVNDSPDSQSRKYIFYRFFSQFYFVSFLLQAANYLDIKGLLDITCKTVGNMIKGIVCLDTRLELV